MNRVLIITGWMVDFACAAALVLHKNPDAEIIGMSKSRLPVYLSGLAEKKDTEYDLIYILGIPLMSNEKKLLSSCRKLYNRNIKLIWLCSYPLPHKIPAGLEKYLTIPPVSDTMLLCRLAADYLKISPKVPKYQNIERIAKYAETNSGIDADKERVMFIEAGMSRYRRFQDEESFPKAIRLIYANAPFADSEKKMLVKYSQFGKRELKGASKAVREIKYLAEKVGKEGNCGVLITGETGTGKETVANLIHGYSHRSEEPFIAFNCADLSPQLLESRLFGHEKGAFTGAERKKQGAFELADGGTLFLDEVGELPLGAQAGLLRVLQEGRFFKLGGEEEISVDVRIIAATNRNLVEMMKEGSFREDLFYRLNVININIPPLRDRIEDLSLIAESYMFSRQQRKLSNDQITSLNNHDWPGNVRELQNILERSIVLREHNFDKLLSDYRKTFSVVSKNESENLDDFIRHKAKKIHEKYEQNYTHAAKALGISINTLKKYLT